MFDHLVDLFLNADVLSAIYRFAGAFLLFILLMGYILRKNSSMQKTMLYSAFRGFLQILFLGSILNIIFEMRAIALLLLVICIMVIFGAQTAAKRHEIKYSFRIYLISLFTSVFFIMSIMSVTGVLPIDNPAFWIPIGGMITGNSMNITYLTISQIDKDIKQRKGEIEAALALGYTPKKIFERLHLVTDAIVLAITPTTNNLRTLGLVFIPGLMTGLLIGGINPIAASFLQVMIFFLIFSGGILSSYIAGHLIVPSFFNLEDQHLLHQYL